MPLFDLPWTLPGDGDAIAYAPIPGFASIEGSALAWIGDYCGEGKSLLLAQFRKPLIEALVCALSTGAQDLENVAWQVLTERWLDNGQGAQLDRIGDLLGLPRAGWDDDTYEAFLRAQVLVLRSSGTWPDLFAILRELGLTLALTTHAEHYPAAMLIVLAEEPPIAGADVFRTLDRARAGGVRLVLEFLASDIEDAFTFSDDDTAMADAARGWAGDDAGTTGGVWIDALASSEGA